MNIPEYISSGIVESYVMGLSSPEESVEFENMCRRYPEVLQARTRFEELMERHAVENAINPPDTLRQEILSAISRPESPVVTMGPRDKQEKPGWWKMAAAACAVLLIGSLVWNLSQYNRNKKLQASYDALGKDFDSTAFLLSELEDQVSMLRLNPNVKMAAMKGTATSPNSFATVYMDTTSKDIYLVVNNLPKPANNKQYQLWALLNGKPIDLGMIDNDYFIGEKMLMLKMKNVSNAQAFAITLEKMGGSPTPEGDMYVLGNL